jgi:hypothetical protein
MTPLEILQTLAQLYLEVGRLDDAARLAQVCAPFVHARLQAVAVRECGKSELHVVHDEGWYHNNAHRMAAASAGGEAGVRLELVEQIVDAGGDRSNQPAAGS